MGMPKTLGLPQAVGLAITMVIGGGMLLLPGMAVERAGHAALWAWVITALAILPLLVVFADLGARHPSAGGISGFVRVALNRRLGGATDVLVMSALPGGAGIALSGGKYLSYATGLPVLVGTIAILTAGAAVMTTGSRISGRVQQGLSILITIILAITAMAALSFAKPLGMTVHLPAHGFMTELNQAIPAVWMVFFAFTGWELMSFISGEFKDPKRDFPKMAALSYSIIVVLYLLMAYAVQTRIPVGSPSLTTAPLAELARLSIGTYGKYLVSILGIIVISSNLTGVIWAFSRMLYSSAKEGLFPRNLAVLDKKGSPLTAIITFTALLALLAIPAAMGLIPHATLFELSGSVFFMSYILSVLAYTAEAKTMVKRITGVIILAGAIGLFLNSGIKALYPLTTFGMGYVLSSMAEVRGKLNSTS